MARATVDPDALLENASIVAGILKTLANERRLLILCELSQSEANVMTLAARVGLSQSALSQHLARMRDEGIVTFRRDGQTLWYRIADARVAKLMRELERLFCRTK